MDQKLMDDFFNMFENDQKINLLKSSLGTIKMKDSINLFEPNEQFKSYLEYKKKFDEANLKFDEIKKSAEKNDLKAIQQLSVSGSLLKKMVDMALQSWITLGYKYEIEKIITKINN